VDLMLVAILAVPILITLTWLSRSQPSQGPEWRTVTFLVGLVAVSVDAAIYYGWLIYRVIVGGTDLAFKIRAVLADNVTIYLAIGALALAILGKGGTRTRVLVGVSALLEIVLWSDFGI